jgi:hypothetical protein
MPEFLTISDPQNPACLRLGGFSRRIASLLLAHANSQTGVLACLDDLLGAVYNLFYATRYEYSDRLKPLTTHDIGNVAVRASDMAQFKIRIDGKWAAGVFFNNGLFRLAGVYHRVLKITAGRPASREYPATLLLDVEQAFQVATNNPWKHGDIKAIYREVTELKHSADGIFEGRSVLFIHAIDAVDEILTLIEVLC